MKKWLLQHPKAQKCGKYGHITAGANNYLEFDASIDLQLCIVTPVGILWNWHFSAYVKLAFFFFSFRISRPKP